MRIKEKKIAGVGFLVLINIYYKLTNKKPFYTEN